MLKKLTVLVLTITSLFFTGKASAQEVLSLEDAISLGLENNYGISIARNEAEIGSITKSLGEAGFLPSVELRGEYSLFEDHVDFTDRVLQEQLSETEETTYQGADIALDWTIFEGFYKITNYKKLAKLESLGKTQANISIENTVSAITEAYFNVVSHKKRIEVLNNTVGISEDRNEIAQTKYDLGAGSEYNLLVTNTDLNVDRTEVIRERRMLYGAKMELVQLLDLETDVDIEVETDIELDEFLSFQELRESTLERNRQLDVAELRTNVAQLEEKEILSRRFPEVAVGASYQVSNEDLRTEVLYDIEKRDGFFYGVTARLNLFDGFRRNRDAQIAKINTESTTYERDRQSKRIETLLLSNYEGYTAAIELVSLEQQNLELAQQALEIALERFRLGNITPVELRESQRTLLNTETRLITSMFEAKIYETELLRLSGKLLEHYQIQPL